MLPKELAAFKGWNQWVVWKIVAGSKVPLNPKTGLPGDAQDPANWMDFDTAVARAKELGANGVGFALTKKDPFFFVDVDNALQDDGQWSPTAKWVLGQFPGAAYEVSWSGNGFHLYGFYTSIIEHSNKNKALGVEFYTHSRFFVVTLEQLAGETTERTAQANAFARYFPPKGASVDAEWTTEPLEGYGFQGDDDALEAAMLGSAPSKAQLIGGATLQDLWKANPGPLGKTYPDVFGSQGRPYDASSADAALALHLAWWTGNDCERIERMMRRSALVRDKWEVRPEWLHNEILEAVGKTTRWYEPRVSVEATATDPSGEITLAAGYQFLGLEAQREHFAGCIYVYEKNQVLTPSGVFMAPQVFRAAYGGYVFAMDSEGKDTSKDAFEVLTQSRGQRYPQVQLTAFRPELPAGHIFQEEGLWSVNTYVKIPIESVPGDVTLFLDYVHKLLPDARQREILMSYMSAAIQNPGAKFQYCIVLQGIQGNGKTFILSVMEAAIGRRYTHWPSASDLGNKFNSWMEGQLLICVEDLYRHNDSTEMQESLKTAITNRRVQGQGKGANQIMMDNRANFMMTANDQAAVRKTADDRRYCCLFTAQQTPADLLAAGWGPESSYFPELYRWARAGGFAAVTNYLQNYQIAAEFNPAGNCHHAPETISTQAAIIASRNPVEQLIQEAIDEERYGFRCGHISTVHVGYLFDENRAVRASPQARAQALVALGYVWHPGLVLGRVPVVMPSEGGKKPRIWVVKDSLQCNLHGATAQQAYLDAQGPMPMGDRKWKAS